MQSNYLKHFCMNTKQEFLVNDPVSWGNKALNKTET